MVDVTLEFIATRIFSDVNSAGTAPIRSLALVSLSPRPKIRRRRTQIPRVRRARTHISTCMLINILGQIFRELHHPRAAIEIIWISSLACRTKDDDRFLAPSLGKGPLAEWIRRVRPRQRLAPHDGWSVNDGLNGRGRRFFSPASKYISRSGEAHFPSGQVPLMMTTGSIYRVPIAARSWDWEIGTQKRKLSVMVSTDSFCRRPTIPHTLVLLNPLWSSAQ